MEDARFTGLGSPEVRQECELGYLAGRQNNPRFKAWIGVRWKRAQGARVRMIDDLGRVKTCQIKFEPKGQRRRSELRKAGQRLKSTHHHTAHEFVRMEIQDSAHLHLLVLVRCRYRARVHRRDLESKTVARC